MVHREKHKGGGMYLEWMLNARSIVVIGEAEPRQMPHHHGGFVPMIGRIEGDRHPKSPFHDREGGEAFSQALKEKIKPDITVVALDGTLTGEHGIGLSKAPFMTLEHDPVAMDVMRTLKKTFDPNNILNPGKMAMEN